LQGVYLPRNKIVFLVLYAFFLLILARLFYWQIIMGKSLRLQSEVQTMRSSSEAGLRGKIFTSDEHLLVGNQVVYDLKLDRQKYQGNIEQLSQQLSPLIASSLTEYQLLDSLKDRQVIESSVAATIKEKFQSKSNWPILYTGLSLESKQKIESLQITNLNFDEQIKRFYPEASMAAHLTGFVGRDEQGFEIGRYGIEGALEDELKARSHQQLLRADALGYLLAGQKYDSVNLNGRDITLTIRRDVQYLLESNLERAMEQYGADRGEIIVLESQTGKILGLATWPKYEAWRYTNYEPDLLKNPSLTRLYEPGSTFKTLTVAAGVDSGAVTPETVCTKCAGPRQIAGYSIKTWNNEYKPNITIGEGYTKSDNTAMIFITDLLGKDRFVDYLSKFGIGERLDIELQDDARSFLPQKIGPVETATMSFGQGISTNSLILMRAINTIANRGQRVEPRIIEKVYDQQNKVEIVAAPAATTSVISPASAATVTAMMILAANSGEAQWTATDKYQVAAKTGTSQIPDPRGGYKSDETITSFIGFAPANDPKFTMLVKLENPKSSPWAAETAAPLWYKVADKLMLLLNVETI